jgi:hypothetical protein
MRACFKTNCNVGQRFFTTDRREGHEDHKCKPIEKF